MTQRYNRKLKYTFTKYVDKNIVNSIVENGDIEAHVGGTKRDIAVLFVDVRGYTTLSENLQAEQPYEKLVRDELAQIIQNLVSELDERQRIIMQMRFGFEDGKCYSLEQISKVLGVSKERTRQLEKQAIDKLRKSGSKIGLEDFLE